MLYILQWLKLTSEDVQEQIFKLAKKGLTPSQIGKKNFWIGIWGRFDNMTQP